MQLLRELDELEDAATGEDEQQAELSLTSLPKSVGVALRSGAERVAVRLAWRAGQRNEDQLTNLIFFSRNPNRWGQRLAKSDPDFAVLSQEWLRIRAEVVRPALASGGSPPNSGGAGQGDLSYAIKPGEEFGGKWRSTRPPGLPAAARRTSAPGAALTPIEKLARAQGLEETFVRLVIHLAKTESGGRFALPAIRFNALPPSERGGAPLITAWGAFSFNRDAWRGLPGVAAGSFPWDATPGEEIGRPIARYAELFRQVLAAGGSDLDAARGVRLWHRSPIGEYKPYLAIGRKSGFAAAWGRLPVERRAKVDGYLQAAGILPAGSQELETFAFEEELEAPPSGIEDRTSRSPRDKHKGIRDPASVTALVLHQMAFSRGNDPAKYDKVTAHFVILPNGHTAQLHPASAILWASNGFNKLTVAVEFAGNFPNVKGRCWKPEKFGCHRVTPEQIAAGRNLIRHLVATLGIRHVLAHRQSSASRANDPGPDLWYHVGQWAVDMLGLSDGGPGFKIGSGNPIPSEWRALR